MRLHSLFSRRPSASMVVSLVALFVALGGASYAAVFLPPGSVGSSQIREHAVNGNKIDFLSVGFRKIQFGAVGTKRINNSQVQERVSGACATNSAISTINNTGGVTCNPTLPGEVGNSTAAIPVNGTATSVSTTALPGGSAYLVQANPQADVTAAAGTQVQVSCTLADGAATQTRSVTFQGGAQPHQFGSTPLAITVPAATAASSASVTCGQSQAGTMSMPTVAVTSSVNALQIASISTPASVATAARKK